MHPSTPPPLPRAWHRHSFSVSVKASEVPRHWVKNAEWSPSPWVLSCTNQSPVCVESAVTAFLKSPDQTLKSISKRSNIAASYANNLCQIFKLLSSVKMEPLTIKSNVNPPLIHQPVGWRSESECSPCPPGKHKRVNMRWLSPLFPCHARGGDGGFQMTVAITCTLTFTVSARFHINTQHLGERGGIHVHVITGFQ